MIGPWIAAEAEEWVGTPFVWQGRVKHVGCDCKGLVAGVAKTLARPEADSLEALCADYGEVIDARRLRTGLARLFDRVSDVQAGDVLLIRYAGKPQHMAIATPREGKPTRVIEALNAGQARGVRPFRRRADEIDSIWRWRA